MIPVLMEQLNYALTFSGLTGRTTAAAAAAAAALMLLCAVYVQHQTLSGHAGLLEGIKRRRKKNFQRLLRGCQQCVTGGVQSKKHFLFLLMLLWKKKTKHQPHKMEGRWRGWWWWWNGGGRFNTCCSILERGAQAKLAAQMANVYNGIESCPA